MCPMFVAHSKNTTKLVRTSLNTLKGIKNLCLWLDLNFRLMRKRLDLKAWLNMMNGDDAYMIYNTPAI